MKVHRKKPRQGQTGEWWIVFTEYCVLTLTPEQDPVPIQGLPPPVSEESRQRSLPFFTDTRG